MNKFQVKILLFSNFNFKNKVFKLFLKLGNIYYIKIHLGINCSDKCNEPLIMVYILYILFKFLF